MKIGFIGLGKLGMPCAEAMAEHHTVTGWDIAHKYSSTIRIVDSIGEVAANQDIIFIAVPTPHAKAYGGDTPAIHLPPKDFDYSFVRSVLNEIRGKVKSNQIVCLISTVLPGTTRREFLPLLDYPEHFVYNPYLIAMGTVKEDFLNPEMVILGGQEKDNPVLGFMAGFYARMCNNAPTMIGTWEEAEAYKVFYNTFISMKLSFVNMIQDVAQKLGHMNVDKVTTALSKSSKRITSGAYMKAGMGDGGACHPRDNIALRYLSRSLHLGYDLFDSIAQSREAQAENLARYLISFGMPIVIVGKSYKPNIGLVDGSYSVLVGSLIADNSDLTVEYHDEDTGDIWWRDKHIPVTALVGHWSRYTEAFLRTLHPDSVIIDPWRKMSTTFKHPGVIHYGNTDVDSL